MIDLRLGDCLDIMRGMDADSVDAIVTSPPYFRKMDYGNGKDQLGLEQTPQEYISNLGYIYAECYRIMREGGTLWIVINDTYNNSAPLRKSLADRKSNDTVPFHTRRKLMEGFREKELLGIPFMLKDKLRDVGFIWRSLNIWHKPNGAYDSCQDRPAINHEYVFQFVKASGHGRPYANIGKISNSVWTIKPESCEGHPCPFPVELARRIIEALPDTAIVFDPMMGSGSTGVAAVQLGRNFIGCDNVPEYVEISRLRIGASMPIEIELPLFAEVER